MKFTWKMNSSLRVQVVKLLSNGRKLLRNSKLFRLRRMSSFEPFESETANGACKFQFQKGDILRLASPNALSAAKVNEDPTTLDSLRENRELFRTKDLVEKI